MAKQAHFSGVSPDAFQQLKGKLQQLGLNLQGESGNINEKGVKARYYYSPESRELAINELTVGFPASMMVNEDSLVQRMTQMIEEYGGKPTT